jgi:hypothetical protein
MITLLLGAALAAPVQLVAGVRDASSTRGDIDGPRLGARYLFGPAALELGVFGNPRPQRIDNLDQTLVAIAYNGDANVDFRQPVINDLAGLSVLLDYGFLKLGEDERLSGGPHLYAGGEVLLQQRLYAVYDEERARQDTGEAVVVYTDRRSVTGGLVLGAGADVWVMSRVGLRMTWTRRLGVQDAPQYDPDRPVDDLQFVSEPMRSLELLVQL